jgi:cell division protein FtsA
MQLILEQVGYEIQLSGFERQLIAGVVLTGGGARMKNIKEFAELVIGLDTRIGTPDEHLDTSGSVNFEDLSHPMYATGIGLVIYGLEAEEAAVQKASQAIETSAPMPESEPVEEEKPSEKKKEKKEKVKKPKDGRNFGGVVSDWLAKIFTEEDLGE